MATNQQAIHDLESAKAAFEAQVQAGASGPVLSNLMAAIDTTKTEIDQLVSQALAAVYVPQTDAFKAVTAEAKTFVATLNAIKTAFTTAGQVLTAVATVMKYVV